MGRGWGEGLLGALILGLLALGLGCRPAAAPPDFPRVAGPVAAEALAEAIATQDRHLAELIYGREDAPALRALLAEDFQFHHHRQGLLAEGPEAFVALVHRGFLAPGAPGRPEPVADSEVVVPLARHGAIHQGEQRGAAAGAPDGLREAGRYFHVWRRSGGAWKLAQIYRAGPD